MNLNPFKKKKKLPFEFKVLVFVPSVDSMQLQTQVDCLLYRDPKDQLLYVVDNVTKGEVFKEIYPGENKKIFAKDELPNIENKLKELKDKYSKLDKKSTENPLNIKKEIYQLEVLLKQYKEPKGSFVIQSGTGEKSIYFLRKSTGNEAIHFDIHNNIAFSPTERNSRDLFNAWKTKYENLKKDEKAPFEKVTQVIAAIVLAGLIIVLAILVWNWLQMDIENQKAMQTQAYICQQESVEAFKKILETNQETSNMLNDFTNNLIGDGTVDTPNVETETIK